MHRPSSAPVPQLRGGVQSELSGHAPVAATLAACVDLFSSVAVKHPSGGGFGKFAKFGGVAASMTPLASMGRGMGSTIAAQSASMAASQMAQQQAMNQLAGFNGQIKSKDDVTVQYELLATGQTNPVLQDSLNGKAKSNREDVLTPLLQQAATAVLTQVSKK